LGNLSPSIRITWPSQAILLLFTYLTVSAFFIRSFSSWTLWIVHNKKSVHNVHCHSECTKYTLLVYL
jgi:hypothetical protein